MKSFNPGQGLGTLVNHVGEGSDPLHAHVTPIYEASAFSFPDVATAAATFKGEGDNYVYTRWGNPNLELLAQKIAVLEGLDLLRARPGADPKDVVGGMIFTSGMAAISAAVLGRVKAGEIVIAQQALFGTTYTFFKDIAPRFGIQAVFIEDPTPEKWEAAFRQHPGATLAYTESPSNPTLALTDLTAAAEIAHRHGAWLLVDNTFASPYCQRPLSLGADIVVHSTTKYISGHGLIMGGAVVSTHVSDFVRKDLNAMLKILGGSASPFDAWLANNGLKTYELRMQRHCENALKVASFLESHSKVERVYYPGLESHPQHALARRQMLQYGGMASFELNGGLDAGISLMNRVRLATLVATLGNVDTLIQHPASMTHSAVPRPERMRMGVTDGLVRLSVGIENVEDIIADLDQALGG